MEFYGGYMSILHVINSKVSNTKYGKISHTDKRDDTLERNSYECHSKKSEYISISIRSSIG